MKVFNSALPIDFECHLKGAQGTHFRVPPKVGRGIMNSMVLDALCVPNEISVYRLV